MPRVQIFSGPGLALMALLVTSFGCSTERGEVVASAPADEASVDPCAIALTEPTGAGPARAAIDRARQGLQHSDKPEAYLERLGWAYMQAARTTFDPGYYQLADQTGQCIAARHPESEAALLLRGTALRSLHRFGEALPLALELVRRRGLTFDHALFGDILVDIGRLDEAAAAYQRMMDLKPGPHAYVRGAELRWRIGDSDGAKQLFRMAYGGTGSGDPEAAAWVRVRLAELELESGAVTKAARLLDEALALSENYPPALLWRGRMLLAAEQFDEAVRTLEGAAATNPLPEYLWTLRDAYLAAGMPADALRAERRLLETGAREDPRGLALYLATVDENTDLALRLAVQELESRQDAITLDAVAWASFAAGDLASAARYSERSLDTGIRHARLYLHSALIADATDDERAGELLARLEPMTGMLLPSERRWLEALRHHRTTSEVLVVEDGPPPTPPSGQ